MFLFKTQHVRNQHGVSWFEEILMGAIYELGRTWTSDVMDSVRGTMSSNTAHKYITQLVEKEYVAQQRTKTDKRYAHLSLTDKGKKYLTEIEEAL